MPNSGYRRDKFNLDLLAVHKIIKNPYYSVLTNLFPTSLLRIPVFVPDISICLFFRYYWDLIVMLILLLNMIMLPLNIAFFGSGQSWIAWMTIHSISDITFMVDIVLNFRTGYRREDTGYNISFILEPRLIAIRYL